MNIVMKSLLAGILVIAHGCATPVEIANDVLPAEFGDGGPSPAGAGGAGGTAAGGQGGTESGSGGGGMATGGGGSSAGSSM